MKEVLSIIAVILTFVAYIPYYRDILKGKTHPHLYTWSLWGLLTILIVALQVIGGAGPSVWITVAAGVMCVGVVVLGFKGGKRFITKTDTIIAILALAAIISWLFVDQPVLSLWLVIVADCWHLFRQYEKRGMLRILRHFLYMLPTGFDLLSPCLLCRRSRSYQQDGLSHGYPHTSYL